MTKLNDIASAIANSKALAVKKQYEMRRFLTAVQMITDYNKILSDSPIPGADTDEHGNQFKFDENGNLTKIYMPWNQE